MIDKIYIIEMTPNRSHWKQYYNSQGYPSYSQAGASKYKVRANAEKIVKADKNSSHYETFKYKIIEIADSTKLKHKTLDLHGESLAVGHEVAFVYYNAITTGTVHEIYKNGGKVKLRLDDGDITGLKLSTDCVRMGLTAREIARLTSEE